ncbi:SsrA-binding protein [Mycoplasma sp. E35C]|uniref:SsrA-binding protein n=1 Tax=Mycoplasma sp. E35C TaxID=2801918 RepID=UPI001CA46817|nr:SsrA-binding protein [Mycoplasma sp. E35C]QZX48812.1 SsrA-binding protein [Mycoplasma sp. E35C]
MRLLVNNKKAKFNYELLDKYEAGISLTGNEVKSLALGHGSLDDSYVIIRKNEAYILNLLVPKYRFDTSKTNNETRTRKLLLHKHEILKIDLVKKQQSLVIIPYQIYFSKNKIKVSIYLAKPKKLHDKRDSLKNRDASREMRRY